MLLLLAAFPLYYELGRTPVQLYDESRVAVNAVEMAQNGHWLVPHYDGTPDHWNTKPPLLIWMQVLCFKLFGISTWSLRLPTLLASLGTLLLLFRFAASTLRKPWAGLLAGVVLVTCSGYVRLHVARTGDYDALLTFWQVLIWTSFFQYLETGSRRQFTWLVAGVIAATFTKGPAGLMGIPGLLVYAACTGRLLWLLRQPGVYLAALVWAVLVTSYFVAREPLDPGYWEAVQNNDLGGRFLTVLDGHNHPWDFYLNNIAGTFFSHWLWGIVPALVGCLVQPDRLVRKAAGLLTLFIAGWLLIISSASSKLYWYDAPVYPALSLLLGLGLTTLYQDFLSLYRARLNRWVGGGILALLLVSVLAAPYYYIVRQIVEERHSDFGSGSDGHLGRYITKVAKQQPDIASVSVLTHGTMNSVMLYYKGEFGQHPNRRLTILSGSQTRTVTPGTTVISCDPAYRASLDSAFQVVELHSDSPCQTLLLLRQRD